jgi:hypothetical protein
MRSSSRRARSAPLSLVALVALVACSTDPPAGDGGAAGLTVKLINTGAIAVVGFHVVPAGTLPETGWEGAAWGANRLPLPRLERLQYVRLPDFARSDVDCVAAFDPAAAVPPLRWNVPAFWISDAPLLTIHCGRDGGDSFSSGHAFGDESRPGEVDVTPQ